MCNNAIYNYSYVCRETRLRYFERLRGKYRKCSYHGSRRYVICLGRKIYFIWRCINLPENPPTSMDDARTLLWPAHSYSSKVSASPSTSTSSSSKLFWPAGFPLLCLFKHLSTCWFNSSGVPDSLSLHTGQDGSSAFRFRFFTRILACAHSKSTFSKGFEKGNKRNSAYRCNFSKILSSIISPLLFCSSISKQICIYGIYCASANLNSDGCSPVYWPWSFCKSPIFHEACHRRSRVHGASAREDDPGDDRVASSTSKLAPERKPRISCKVCRVPGRSVARAPAALLSPRMPDSRMDQMEISFYLETSRFLSFWRGIKNQSLFMVFLLARPGRRVRR